MKLASVHSLMRGKKSIIILSGEAFFPVAYYVTDYKAMTYFITRLIECYERTFRFVGNFVGV